MNFYQSFPNGRRAACKYATANEPANAKSCLENFVEERSRRSDHHHHRRRRIRHKVGIIKRARRRVPPSSAHHKTPSFLHAEKPRNNFGAAGRMFLSSQEIQDVSYSWKAKVVGISTQRPPVAVGLPAYLPDIGAQA